MSASLASSSSTPVKIFDSLQSPQDRLVSAGAPPLRSTIAPLTDEDTIAGMGALNKDLTFLKVDRRYADPEIQNQKITLVSFVPSKNAKPDSDGIFGMMKVRGVFATEDEANERAEWLIRNTDSLHDIYHTFVGRPFPVTTRSGYEKEIHTIDIRQKTVELISEDILSKRAKERQETEELQEKEKILLDESRRAQDNVPPDAFEVYITEQVKRAQLIWTYNETIKKVRQMEESYKRTVEHIRTLDQDHPEYQTQYREQYMKARREAGIPDDENSFLKYLNLDLSAPIGQSAV